jgi:hypothetical protein
MNRTYVHTILGVILSWTCVFDSSQHFWNYITIITKAIWAQLSFYFSFLDKALLKQCIFLKIGNGTKELPYCNEVARGCNYCKWVWINLTKDLIPCNHLFTWLKLIELSNAWFWVALKMKNGCIHINMTIEEQ